MGYKINKYNSKIYTIIGDGESNEGTIWESAMLASQYQLDNLYCILDYNKSGNRALTINNVMDRFRSFGWFCCEIDGHDHEKLEYSLNNKNANKQPIFILANTIKGCGCKLMENTTEWHHKHPNEEEYKKLIETIY
jgi:transketolase